MMMMRVDTASLRIVNGTYLRIGMLKKFKSQRSLIIIQKTNELTRKMLSL
jgi:hypothetical protein